MKPTLLQNFEKSDLNKITDEASMNSIRINSMVQEKNSKDVNEKKVRIPRSAIVFDNSLLDENMSIDDLTKVDPYYFLSVKARKIVYDALGINSSYDIKRFRKQFPNSKSLISELEVTRTPLNVKGNGGTNMLQPTIRNTGACLSETSPNDFSIFSNASQFQHQINSSEMSVIDCIVAYLKYKSVSVNKRSLLCHFPSLIYYFLLLQHINKCTFWPVVIGNFFLSKFEIFLRYHDLSTNTILSMINSLKAVLKWAALYGARLAIDIDGYKLKESDNKPKVSLTFEEICKIYYYDFNNLKISDKLKKTYERVRDHFILDCFLGQRFGDTPRITKENFCGSSYDTFRITQQKTGNKAVVSFNKLYGEYPIIVKEILEKYDYEAPFTGTMSTFNSRLHEICMYAGLTEEVKYEKKVKGAIEERTFKKYELISSHCARRTFITNAVKRKLHSQDIMRASGHTSEKSFGKYVIWGDDAK